MLGKTLLPAVCFCVLLFGAAIGGTSTAFAQAQVCVKAIPGIGYAATMRLARTILNIGDPTAPPSSNPTGPASGVFTLGEEGCVEIPDYFHDGMAFNVQVVVSQANPSAGAVAFCIPDNPLYVTVLGKPGQQQHKLYIGYFKRDMSNNGTLTLYATGRSQAPACSATE